jgi:hypothetical protein
VHVIRSYHLSTEWVRSPTIDCAEVASGVVLVFVASGKISSSKKNYGPRLNSMIILVRLGFQRHSTRRIRPLWLIYIMFRTLQHPLDTD